MMDSFLYRALYNQSIRVEADESAGFSSHFVLEPFL